MNKIDNKKAKCPKTQLPTPEMIQVMIKSAIKNLKRPKGASFDDISEYIEGKYQVNMEVLKSCFSKVLNEGVEIGAFEKINNAYFTDDKSLDSRKTLKSARSSVQRDPVGAEIKILENAPTPENTNPEKKAENRLLTREMVIMMIKLSIKCLNERNGASLDDIAQYMEEKYRVNMKTSKYCIHNILEECTDNGVLQKIRTKTVGKERYKIKESSKSAQ